jgi:hypothetical protein
MEGLQLNVSLGKMLARPISKNKLGLVVQASY